MSDQSKVRRLLGLALVAGAVAWMLAACSTPEGQQIRSVDSSKDTVKMTYDEETSAGDIRRGIIECDVDGEELKNCRRLDVEYR